MTTQELIERFRPYAKDWFWYNGDKATGGTKMNAIRCAIVAVDDKDDTLIKIKPVMYLDGRVNPDYNKWEVEYVKNKSTLTELKAMLG